MNKFRHCYLLASTLASALFASHAFAATLCYGSIAEDACTTPNLSVPPSAVIDAPADFEVTTDRSVTLFVSIRSGLFIGAPVVAGGRILSAGSRTLTATCSPTAPDDACIVALPGVAGIAPGDTLTADVRLFDPNGVTAEIFSGPVDLATMDAGQLPPATGEPLFFGTVWMLNPALNDAQRTFARIVAPEGIATVTLWAFDDSGSQRGPLLVTVPGGGAVQINPSDIENGNPNKGIPIGTGRGVGKWRLSAESSDPFRIFGYGVGISLLSSD